MKKLLVILLVTTGSLYSYGQFEDSEIISKAYSFEKEAEGNVFMLSNINGEIKVEAHSGSEIILEAKKVIEGKTAERVEKGMSEVQLSLIDRYDTLIVHLTNSCTRYGKYGKNKSQYSYNWQECDLKYDFKLDISLKVPASTNLVLSTVNEGDIEVKGVSGSLHVNNINGAIALNDVEGKVYASTINGDVDVNYNENPDADSRYYTLNGDINANFREGLAARIGFKSFNGDLYTNLDVEQLPTEISKEEINDGKGLKIKIDERRLVQARNGSILLDFETFNGDAIVKEN